MKDVTKEEFLEWKEKYPNELVYNVAMISEPPTGCYYDFSKGEGLDALVATVCLTEKYPKEGIYPYTWKPNTYRIE